MGNDYEGFNEIKAQEFEYLNCVKIRVIEMADIYGNITFWLDLVLINKPEIKIRTQIQPDNNVRDIKHFLNSVNIISEVVKKGENGIFVSDEEYKLPIMIVRFLAIHNKDFIKKMFGKIIFTFLTVMKDDKTYNELFNYVDLLLSPIVNDDDYIGVVIDFATLINNMKFSLEGYLNRIENNIPSIIRACYKKQYVNCDLLVNYMKNNYKKLLKIGSLRYRYFSSILSFLIIDNNIDAFGNTRKIMNQLVYCIDKSCFKELSSEIIKDLNEINKINIDYILNTIYPDSVNLINDEKFYNYMKYLCLNYKSDKIKIRLYNYLHSIIFKASKYNYNELRQIIEERNKNER